MKNPFKPVGLTEVPVVERSNEAAHTMNVISIEMDHLKDEKAFAKHQSDSGSEKLSPDAQDGVLAMEATTIVWTKHHLIAAYVL